MIWESDNKECNRIVICDEKILETFSGWYIEQVYYSDKKSGKEINSLTIVIRQDK